VRATKLSRSHDLVTRDYDIVSCSHDLVTRGHVTLHFGVKRTLGRTPTCVTHFGLKFDTNVRYKGTYAFFNIRQTTAFWGHND
jgi:hypothetical protein